MSKRRSSSSAAADRIVAATAGEDTWKTYAGRNHGTDQFEVLDLFRGMKRSLRHRFLSSKPSSGTPCPVCYCEPDGPDQWHVTWCGHAVCKDCLQQYATSQVQDKEQSGPLKCPVCPQVLRRKDAIVALGGNTELISQWDTKIRNQLLRALPNYRPCPKCSNGRSNTNKRSVELECSGGGGFVTSECLKPHYDERRDAATKILKGRTVLILLLVLVYFSVVSIMNSFPSASASVDLFFMIILIYPFVKIGLASEHWLAQTARRRFFEPITVECPCCNESFILPAESKFLQDDESSRWMDANTRQCPSCSAKIVKSGGCNHMHCSNCKADFCWACMRLRTSCKAYRCVNGAKYGNAVPGGPGQDGPRAPQADDSILTVIDYLLSRRRQQVQYQDCLIVFACLFARQLRIVQYLVGWVMSIFTSVLFSQILFSQVVMGSTMLFLSGSILRDLRTFFQNRRQQVPPNRRRGNIRQINPLLQMTNRNQRQIIEQEMIQEAIRRSIRDM